MILLFANRSNGLASMCLYIFLTFSLPKLTNIKDHCVLFVRQLYLFLTLDLGNSSLFLKQTLAVPILYNHQSAKIPRW